MYVCNSFSCFLVVFFIILCLNYGTLNINTRNYVISYCVISSFIEWNMERRNIILKKLFIAISWGNFFFSNKNIACVTRGIPNSEFSLWSSSYGDFNPNNQIFLLYSISIDNRHNLKCKRNFCYSFCTVFRFVVKE